jgi:uncharacterized protein (DUF488 family)
MQDVLFTLGYQKRSIDEFVELARSAEIDVLIDVRETAWSHKPGFSKAAFADALRAAGIQYVHAPFAGNPKWLRESAESHAECLSFYEWYLEEFDEVVVAFEDMVDEVVRAGRKAVLTCFERHAADCHRSILAARWAARSPLRVVQHLATDGCDRLIQI